MEIYETQPERTDLPLVVMPVIIESMIEPFEKNFELLKDIARVRMYKDFTLDEDTIVERCAEADAIMVSRFHPRSVERQMLCIRRHRRGQLHRSRQSQGTWNPRMQCGALW